MRRRALQIETVGGCIKAWQIYAFMTARPNIGEFYSERLALRNPSQYFSLKYDFHFSQHLFSYLLAPFFMCLIWKNHPQLSMRSWRFKSLLNFEKSECGAELPADKAHNTASHPVSSKDTERGYLNLNCLQHRSVVSDLIRSEPSQRQFQTPH